MSYTLGLNQETKPFEYEIGESVSVYTNEGYEQETVIARMHHNGTRYYQVTGFMNPIKEAFLRKLNPYKPSIN